MTTDLSLVVTVHSETLVCGPTMESAEHAVAAARAAGHSVQPIIALDNATDDTADYFAQSCFDDWERRVLHEGDPGRVRNAIVPQTDGRFVAFLDGDDLFSENWLSDGVTRLKQAEDEGARMIAHPELNVIFDGGTQLNHNIGQASPLFTPHFLYVRNCYDTLCLTPRQAHLDVPYGGRDIARGISREDWQFGVETMARGWEHVVIPDTIIFKRRRDFSMMVESAGRGALVRSLPEMSIDAIRDLTRQGR
jgi:glycosyltransferase involved in cell wall biosynthesis